MFFFFFFGSFSVLFFKSFSCVDEDDLGFLFVLLFVLDFGGRAEGNVHVLDLKNTSILKKKPTRSKRKKGREKIIFKIIKHKNPGASYIIKYVLKNPQTIIHKFMIS